MLTRIGAVIMCVVSAAWVARELAWDSLITFLTFLGAYLGIEWAHRKREAGTIEAERRPKPEREGTIQYVDEERLLIHIAEAGPKEADEMVEPLKLSKIKMEFCAERLEENGYLERAAIWTDRRPFRLTQKAREYLLRHSLIK